MPEEGKDLDMRYERNGDQSKSDSYKWGGSIISMPSSFSRMRNISPSRKEAEKLNKEEMLDFIEQTKKITPQQIDNAISASKRRLAETEFYLALMKKEFEEYRQKVQQYNSEAE